MSGDTSTDLSVQSAPSDAARSIRVDLLKVYVLQVNEAKSANVAVRVHFDGSGIATREAVYRGTATSVDWASGSGEAQGVLNLALRQLLAQLDHDILVQCRSSAAPAHP